MSTLTQIPASTAPVPSRPRHSAPLWLRLLDHLAERNRRYRDSQRLSEMPESRLRDLNIPEELRHGYAARRRSAAERDRLRFSPFW